MYYEYGIEIYDENMELVINPDLEKGYIKHDTRIVHHEGIKYVGEVWHYETIREYPNGGKDVRKVIDVPGVEEREPWDEEVPVMIYVPYTQEELDRMEAERNKPTQEERIEALEAQLAAYEAAYTQGVNEA